MLQNVERGSGPMPATPICPQSIFIIDSWVIFRDFSDTAAELEWPTRHIFISSIPTPFSCRHGYWHDLYCDFIGSKYCTTVRSRRDIRASAVLNGRFLDLLFAISMRSSLSMDL